MRKVPEHWLVQEYFQLVDIHSVIQTGEKLGKNTGLWLHILHLPPWDLADGRCPMNSVSVLHIHLPSHKRGDRSSENNFILSLYLIIWLSRIQSENYFFIDFESMNLLSSKSQCCHLKGQCHLSIDEFYIKFFLWEI